MFCYVKILIPLYQAHEKQKSNSLTLNVCKDEPVAFQTSVNYKHFFFLSSLGF